MFDSDTMMLTDNEHLLKAAKKNYNQFKVPTGLVKAKKTQRYYTDEQKADLDIKTSVNKIGEIINFSQVLNNLYWNRISEGSTHEELLELYCDICQLDVMSNIEIDSAKKEFETSNTIELQALRTKYKEELTTEDGKAILPLFFGYISELKGYNNTEKKEYRRFNTTMDHIQIIMQEHKRSAKRKKYYPLVSILDKEKYNTSKINEGQITRIIKGIREHVNKTKQTRMKLREGRLDYDECSQIISTSFDVCVEDIQRMRLGYSTMYKLISLCEEKDFSDIKGVLFEVLFSVGNKDFYKVIEHSRENYIYIEQSDKEEEMKLFGLDFHKFQIEEKNTKKRTEKSKES